MNNCRWRLSRVPKRYLLAMSCVIVALFAIEPFALSATESSNRGNPAMKSDIPVHAALEKVLVASIERGCDPGHMIEIELIDNVWHVQLNCQEKKLDAAQQSWQVDRETGSTRPGHCVAGNSDRNDLRGLASGMVKALRVANQESTEAERDFLTY